MLVKMRASGNGSKVRPMVAGDHLLDGATARNSASAYGC